VFFSQSSDNRIAARRKADTVDSSLLILILSLCFVMIALASSGVLVAEELSSPQAASAPKAEPAGFDLSSITAADIAGKRLSDTGWPCGQADRRCCHVIVNNSGSILCIPAEIADGLLMIPIEHFRLIAGCGLEITMDGKLKLTKDGRSSVLQADSPHLVRGDGLLRFPVIPYKVYGYTFVPLRFLCDVMGLEVHWHDESDTVLLSSPGVDAVSLLPYMRTINAVLLKAVKEFEGPYGESIELTVTFYYTSKKTTYTASGYPAEAGTIAADLSIPFGTRFSIPELSFIRPDGVFTVKDRGRRVTGNNIDVFVPNSLRDDPDVSAAIRRGRYTVHGYMLRPNE